MLEKYLNKLCEELSISPIPQKDKERVFSFQFNDSILTKLTDLEPGIAISSDVCKCPTKNREDLFIWLMRANLLGQGAGGCRLGLDLDEKVLTLSLGLPYEMNYSLFKERFEDFVNYVIYWRSRIEKLETEGVYPQ